MTLQQSDYTQAIRWIFDRINYERVRPRTASGHFCLDRVRRLLELIGSPQQRIPAVHIAGTKGKGSTAAFLDAILQKSGIMTGLFTSPHIHRFEERMKVNGREPTPEQLAQLCSRLQEILAAAEDGLQAHQVTYFEVATLLAWMYFEQQKVELVVLETGLGGRLDTTNVCNPLVTIITVIGLDHTQILGDTIEQITYEKAGIIKPGVPLVTAASQPDAIRVITDAASANQCRVWRLPMEIQVAETDTNCAVGAQCISVTTPKSTYPRIELTLAGEHQRLNAALAVAAADLLRQERPQITREAVIEGIAATRWPVRFEVVKTRPTFQESAEIVLDVAHNPDSVEAFAETFQTVYGRQSPSILIFACSKDKDALSMLKLLRPLFDRIVLTEFQENPRALSRHTLAELARQAEETNTSRHASPIVLTRPDPLSSLALAEDLANDGGVIGVVGSFFLAAEVREILRQRQLVH